MLITNYHVIKGTDQFAAHLSSGESVDVRVVGTAPSYDIAVLQLERTHAPLYPIAVGASSNLQVGQAAFGIGNPYGLEQTLTAGIISGLHRQIPTAEGGEIAGGYPNGRSAQSRQFRRPFARQFRPFDRRHQSHHIGFGRLRWCRNCDTRRHCQSCCSAADPRRSRADPRDWIAAAPEAAITQGGDGVVILRVFPGSPAAKAGLRRVTGSGGVGDVITAANGQPVHDVTELAGIFQQLGAGKTVTLTVSHGDHSRPVAVTLSDVSQIRAKA